MDSSRFPEGSTVPIQRQHSDNAGKLTDEVHVPIQCTEYGTKGSKKEKDHKNDRIQKDFICTIKNSDAIVEGRIDCLDDTSDVHVHALLKKAGVDEQVLSEKEKGSKELESSADLCQGGEKVAEGSAKTVAVANEEGLKAADRHGNPDQEGTCRPDNSEEPEEKKTNDDTQKDYYKASDIEVDEVECPEKMEVVGKDREDNQKEDKQREEVEKFVTEGTKEDEETAKMEDSELDKEPDDSQMKMVESEQEPDEEEDNVTDEADREPSVLEGQADAKDAETANDGNKLHPDMNSPRKINEKNDKRKRGKTPFREFVNMSKAGESVLANGSLKVKRAANQTSGKDGKNSGNTSQSRGGHNQVYTERTRAGAGAKNIRGGGGEDDDEDGDGSRKGEDLGCDRPAPEKKSPPNEGSEPPIRVPPGARPKETRKGPRGDTGPAVSYSQKQKASSRGNQPGTLSSLNQEMEQMSIGAGQADVGPGAVNKRPNRLALDGYFSCGPSPTNQEAYKQFLEDGGIQAPHEMHVGGANSVPGTMYAKAANNVPREVHAGSAICAPLGMQREVYGGGAFSGPREARASASILTPPLAQLAGADVQPRESAEPMDVDPGVEVQSSPMYGQPKDLAAYANHLQGQQHEETQGRHDGVILDQDLKLVGGEYREGCHYNKVDFLGRGSFGTVYLIQDMDSGKKVVRKRVTLKKFSPSEAALVCGLEHPNIMALIGLVRTDDMVDFFFDYHQGCLDLHAANVLGQGRALHLIEQVFNALMFLHENNIVHKDIKPKNIVVLNDHIWLIDFGSAMRLSAAQHTDSALKGTVYYMAPEIAASTAYDHRIDVWSAFCTLICLISGHPPWSQRFTRDPTCTRMIYMIVTNEAPLADVPENTHPRLKEFIAFGLVKNFNNRPTAARVLEKFPHEIVDELYTTSAIGIVNEPENPSMEAAGIPADAFPGPLTPCTPRPPQDENFNPFAAPQSGGLAVGQLPERMSLSGLPGFYLEDKDEELSLEIPSSVGMESASRDQPRGHSGGMEVDEEEEDMYGPSMDADMESENAEPVAGSPVQPVSGGRLVEGLDQVYPTDSASQNSQATLSFLCDKEGEVSSAHPSANDQAQATDDIQCSADQSFEPKSELIEAGQMPSASGGAAVTSGFDSDSPGHSAEDGKYPLLDSLGEKVARTGDTPQVG